MSPTERKKMRESAERLRSYAELVEIACEQKDTEKLVRHCNHLSCYAARVEQRAIKIRLKEMA